MWERFISRMVTCFASKQACCSSKDQMLAAPHGWFFHQIHRTVYFGEFALPLISSSHTLHNSGLATWHRFTETSCEVNAFFLFTLVTFVWQRDFVQKGLSSVHGFAGMCAHVPSHLP